MQRERQRVSTASRADVEPHVVGTRQLQQRVERLVVGPSRIHPEARRDRRVEIGWIRDLARAINLFPVRAHTSPPGRQQVRDGGLQRIAHEPSVAARLTLGSEMSDANGAWRRHGRSESALLNDLVKRRILVLDGAMGTMVQRYTLSEEDFRGERFKDHPKDLKGANDLLVLTRPEIVREIHDQYLDAGADIIETDTFNATAISMADYGLEPYVEEMNQAAATIAREAADAATAKTPDKPRFVAGALGPTNRTASLSPDVNDPGARNVTWDELVEAYTTAARGLVAGGADILQIETGFDTLNTKAAIFAVEALFDELGFRLPVVVSGTIVDQSGRTLSGQTVGAFWNSVKHARPFAVGLNCSLGAKMLRPYVAELARIADVPVITYPNAGLPNAFGGYDEQPAETSGELGQFARDGILNIVGSCCGTTPDHTRAIAQTVEGMAPRQVPNVEPKTRLSGLEPLDIAPDSLFVNVGERTNVTGSRAFARLIKEERYTEAVEIARQQVENGAQMIDVNMDEALLDSEAAMARFLNLIAAEPDIAKVPVMIDSSKWSVIEEGLKHVQGRPVVNSLSLKEGEEEFLRQARLARRYGAAVIVMAFDEEGQADTVERKLAIAKRAYQLLIEDVGFEPTDLIFDPNIFAIGTGIEEHAGYGVAYIDAVRRVKKELPGVAGQRRRLQRLVLVPRQRPGSRGDPRRLPVPRHQGGHGHGHRQRRRAAGLRRHLR